MAEETTDMNTKTDEASAERSSESVVSPKKTITKAAETKLKEMSRKANERGKSNSPNTSRPGSEPVIAFNQNCFIGGFGLTAIIAIGYFIYKSRGAVSEPPPELQPFHHVPEEEKTKKEDANSFGLNSF